MIALRSALLLVCVSLACCAPTPTPPEAPADAEAVPALDASSSASEAVAPPALDASSSAPEPARASEDAALLSGDDALAAQAPPPEPAQSTLLCPEHELGFTLLDVGEVHLNVACRGLGPKTIVFLHGYPGFYYSWQGYVEPLVSQGFRVVMPDLRGYNLSDKPSAVEAYALDRLVADVDAVIKAASKGRVLLVAYDWGGVVGWVYASRHADRLRGAVLLAAPHPDIWYRPEVDATQAKAAEQYVPLLAGPLGELTFLTYDLSLGPYLSDEELAKYHEAWDRPNAKVSMNNWYRANAYPELKTPTGIYVGVKTLAIWGAQDELVTPSESELLPKFVSDLTVVKFQSDHWFPLSMKAEVLVELLRFEPTLPP
jgi:pimeloyl-ACP methyl ester carboxylesterase